MGPVLNSILLSIYGVLAWYYFYTYLSTWHHGPSRKQSVSPVGTILTILVSFSVVATFRLLTLDNEEWKWYCQGSTIVNSSTLQWIESPGHAAVSCFKVLKSCMLDVHVYSYMPPIYTSYWITFPWYDYSVKFAQCLQLSCEQQKLSWIVKVKSHE